MVVNLCSVRLSGLQLKMAIAGIDAKYLNNFMLSN